MPPLAQHSLITVAMFCVGCSATRHPETHWVPLTAEYGERTYVIQQDGQRKLNDEEAGVFLRTSDGSDVMFRQPIPGGILRAPGDAVVRDSQGKVAYNLLYGLKKVVIKQRWTKPVRDRLHAPAPGRFVGKKVIDGLECVGATVTGANIISGTDWISIPYDITVLRDYRFKGTKPGEIIELISEIKNIKIGLEPDISKYRMPPDFEVVNPTANSAGPHPN